MQKIKIFVLFSYLLYAIAFAAIPDWWVEYGVMSHEYAESQYSHELMLENYSAANIGQLKNMATQAAAYLETHGGAGDQVAAIVLQFNTLESKNTPENKHAFNVGQLKVVSKVFYDRLYELKSFRIVEYPVNMQLISGGKDSDSHKYPWRDPSRETPDQKKENYMVANIGQLKYLFSWSIQLDLSGDSNNNGIPDTWEYEHFGRILDPGEWTDDCDLDRDGIRDIYEFKLAIGCHSAVNNTTYDHLIHYDENSMIQVVHDIFLERDSEGNVVILTIAD